MDEARHTQSENESDRKRHNAGVRFNNRLLKKKIKLNGGPLTKSAAKVDQISKSSDGNDRDGNDELGIKHPFSESIDLYDLPLEMLDVILEKTYLHWVLNSPTEQRDEEVIRSLISVDVCFNKRITRKRFKKAIWRYLRELYGKTRKRHAIIRNNRNYLENNIQLNDELLASLLSLNCITEQHSQFIQRHRSIRNKNCELLHAIELFDETTFSTFVNCLRHTNQRTVAKIIENGGGVIEIQVKTRDAKCTASMINDLRDRTKPRSHETDKLIVQLRDEGIDILSSQVDGQTVVVWIWCHSETAIENIQRLYESNHLRDKYFENLQPSMSKVINIDSNQFKKTVVMRPITINITQRIEMLENEGIWGVTKLRNEIYALFDTGYRVRYVPRICVFEDRYPFRLQKDFTTKEIKAPLDIGSSDKENCLYVSDTYLKRCVWKITREKDDQHKIIKWLTINYPPSPMSVSRDGELLMINVSSPCRLMIYGSDAELIRSIPLTSDIKDPRHAVETSIGNFIIIADEEDYDDGEEEEDVVMEERKNTDRLESKHGKSGSNRRKRKLVVSELTRDGQMVIRRFIPSNKTQELGDCFYLSIDSDDRVVVADIGNMKVILLASDLKCNRILCPTKEEKEEQILIPPWRLFYDEEMKQMIVGGYLPARSQINVYTLSRY